MFSNLIAALLSVIVGFTGLGLWLIGLLCVIVGVLSLTWGVAIFGFACMVIGGWMVELADKY